MKTLKLYYDHAADELTFTNRKHIARWIVKIAVPDGTVRDGDCVVLPDALTAVFKNRRVSPLELYLRASVGWGDEIQVVEGQIHGTSTFGLMGKAKRGA